MKNPSIIFIILSLSLVFYFCEESEQEKERKRQAQEMAESNKLEQEIGDRVTSMFKVVALRNVIKTHPYFHDGSITSLEKTVKIISKVNLRRDLIAEEVAGIMVF